MDSINEISQQMLDAMKHITDDNFFFQEDSAKVHHVLKMICNDSLVVKVNCWPCVFNIIKSI